MERLKTIVGKACVAHYQKTLAEQCHLCPHVVIGKSPLFVGKLAINLVDVQGTDKVNVALLRNGEVTLLDVKR